jgi:hypothetical protein
MYRMCMHTGLAEAYLLSHATPETNPSMVAQACHVLLPVRGVGHVLVDVRWRLWRIHLYPDSHCGLSFVRRLGRLHGHRLYRTSPCHAAAMHPATNVCHVLLPARAVGRMLVDVLIVCPAARLDGACSELHGELELSARGIQLLHGGFASFDSGVRSAAVRQLCMQGEPGASHQHIPPMSAAVG